MPPSPPNLLATLRRAAGAGLGFGGILSLFLAGRNAIETLGQVPLASATGQMGAVMLNLGFGVVFAAISVVCVYAGLQVLREAPVKMWLLLVGLLPQLFSVVVSGFQYRFSSPGFIGAGAHSIGPMVRVGMLFQNGSQMVIGFDSMDEWVVQLNLGAVVVGGLILIRPKPKVDDSAHGEGPESIGESLAESSARKADGEKADIG